MKTVIMWLWLLPLPLTFLLELATGSSLLLVIADLFALATALPILVRIQSRASAGAVRASGCCRWPLSPCSSHSSRSVSLRL